MPADDAVGDTPVVTGSPEPASARFANSLDGTQGDLDHTGGKAWDEVAQSDGGGEEPDAKSSARDVKRLLQPRAVV